MKANYELVKHAIDGMKDEWQDRMDLGHVAITHSYLEAFNETDHLTVAETQAMWEYRTANVRWWLPSAARLDMKELESTLVHEYTHILLAPVELKIPDKHLELKEFTVESIARALLRSKYGTK
jgi:hypothetical protein